MIVSPEAIVIAIGDLRRERASVEAASIAKRLKVDVADVLAAIEHNTTAEFESVIRSRPLCA